MSGKSIEITVGFPYIHSFMDNTLGAINQNGNILGVAYSYDFVDRIDDSEDIGNLSNGHNPGPVGYH